MLCLVLFVTSLTALVLSADFPKSGGNPRDFSPVLIKLDGGYIWSQGAGWAEPWPCEQPWKRDRNWRETGITRNHICMEGRVKEGESLNEGKK